MATVEDALASDELFQLPKIFAEEAILRGQNETFSSPFSERARDLGIDFEGGKLDDTTVIIAKIQNVSNGEESEQKEEL